MTDDVVSDCIFCNLSQGESPADIVHQTEATIFFRDISPKAPVHVLGIPRKHLSSFADMTEADHQLIGQLFHDATNVAEQIGVAESGYRLVSNSGSDAGQVVDHLHIHILGGEPLGPLRC